MSWGKSNTSSNSVLWSPVYINKTSNTANRDALFANTFGGNSTVNSFITNANTGVFFATVNSTSTSLDTGVTSAGWVLRKSTVVGATGARRNRFETLVALAAPSGDDNVPS